MIEISKLLDFAAESFPHTSDRTYIYSPL